MVSDTNKLPDFKTTLKLNSLTTDRQPTGPSDWSANLINALTAVDSEYIIYLQEDYVFTRPVDQQRLNTLLDYIQNNKVNYVRFYTAPPGNGEQIHVSDNIDIKEILPGSQWRTSLMVAIWKKETLQMLLNNAPGIDPWSFERVVDSNSFDKFYCLDLPKNDESDILPFIGIYGSSNGYSFYPAAIELLEKEGIKKLDGQNLNYNIRL